MEPTTLHKFTQMRLDELKRIRGAMEKGSPPHRG
jgi:hypothetical protein